MAITNLVVILQVTFSMLEIYNEQVRNLLDPDSFKVKGGLKIRQHPKKGFFGEYRRAWTSNYTHGFVWDVIDHSCLNLSGGLAVRFN